MQLAAHHRFQGLAAVHPVAPDYNPLGLYPHHSERGRRLWDEPGRSGERRLRRVLSDARDGAGITTLLGCGMVSSSCAMTVTYPIGLIRTRLQASGMPGVRPSHRTARVTTHVYPRTECSGRRSSGIYRPIYGAAFPLVSAKWGG